MDSQSAEYLFDGVSGPPAGEVPLLVLAHGAGAAMDSPYMNAFAVGLASRGLAVARFEFPYMIELRRTGGRRPPNGRAVLLEAWGRVVEALGPARRLVIGGKSMGGRMASLWAAQSEARGAAEVASVVAGVVCLGYPFHPAGRPEKALGDPARTAHLAALKTPTLIVQGTRDALGGQDLVAGLPLSPAVRVHWLGDGDHGFRPRKKSGRTEQQNWSEGMDAVAAFVADLFPGRT